MNHGVFGPYKKEKQHLERSFRVDVVRLLERQSVFRSDGGTVEGVVLRIDEGDWLQERFKIVRSDFIAGCGEGHWSKRTIEKQRVDYEFAQEYVQTCYPLADAEEASNFNGEEDQRKLPAFTKEQLAARKRARRRVPRCVMLMGLPGAGKSTFSKELKENGDEWIYVNQDELGRKQAFKEAGKASRAKRIIIDRCHPTEAERHQWFDAIHSPPKGEVALVHFSASAEECITRVVNRFGHPNVPANGGAYIVQQVAARLEPPTAHEMAHVFGTVETVASFAESQALLRKWGIDTTA
jgi:bifunctional polynucleotide phosphatase/kinase